MPDVNDEEEKAKPVARRVVEAIDDAVHGAVGALDNAAGAALDLTVRHWEDRPGARVRAVRRRGHRPLAVLYEEHPEARRASPRPVGVKTIDVDDVAGTAIGGAHQRGGDFLPLKPFRSNNWRARWQRLRNAADRLAILPPIDVLRFADRYWVLDGHNRVAAALYGGQLAIDANVTELLLAGQRASEAPASLAAQVDDSRDVRSALSRRGRPAEPTDEAGEDKAGS